MRARRAWLRFAQYTSIAALVAGATGTAWFAQRHWPAYVGPEWRAWAGVAIAAVAVAATTLWLRRQTKLTDQQASDLEHELRTLAMQ